MSRPLHPGMGVAVAERTVFRKLHPVSRIELTPDEVKAGAPFAWETWDEVSHRVAVGNAVLDGNGSDYDGLADHINEGRILLSGRHLQHGDANQPSRPQFVFSNCSTAALCYLSFNLLLNGSGVGRLYDDNLMLVPWDDQPHVVQVIDYGHADVMSGRIKGYLTEREARHLYQKQKIVYHRVEDSREGWAKAVAAIEFHAWAYNRDIVLMLDYSDVRPFGSPIKGMQNRPSSGPGPMMQAVENIKKLRDLAMPRWMQAMYVDHFLAEIVLVGGARRAARIAVKSWDDPGIFDFIQIKRGGFLWSANNSVGVTQEFWNKLEAGDVWATKVYDAVIDAQFNDGTGEPAFINLDKLDHNNEGLEVYREKLFTDFYDEGQEPMLWDLTERALSHHSHMIVNPCGEIALFVLGGLCIIGDGVPYHCKSDEEVEDLFKHITRALIRVNRMDGFYNVEVARTNRIGVSITGLHEYAWARFGLGFLDMIEEGEGTIMDANGNAMPAPSNKALPFWHMLQHLAHIVDVEAESYSAKLGMNPPHTRRTMKPAGTTSKLFGLTEAAHLPAMRKYLRWVQFRNDDPLVEQYKAKGYPTRQLQTYSGTTIVGFPTAPVITTLWMGDKLMTAAEATPEQQFRWLRLLETYWIGRDHGNQVSYTLKYDPKVWTIDTYKDTMRKHLPYVRAVSVMPQVDTTAYEYTPEQSITDEEYEALITNLVAMGEDIGMEHLTCATGGCPI